MSRLTGLLIATLLVGCGQPAPSGPSAGPSVALSPSPTVQTAAVLSVRGHEAFGACGSFGGCAYYVELDGPSGSWQAEFETRKGIPDGIALVIDAGLPPTLVAGRYTVSLTKKLVSDAIENGVRQIGPTSAACASSFTVFPGQPSVAVEVEFEFDTCAATFSD